MVDKTINIFISHHHCDEKYIDAFKEKLKGKYNLRDSSIVESNPNNATNPDYIKNEYLRPSIDWAGKLIVLIGKETKNSTWVDWEIEYADRKGYPIIVEDLPGSTEDDLPQSLQDCADSFISWNNDSGLHDAIEGAIISDSSDGTPRVSTGGGGVVC